MASNIFATATTSNLYVGELNKVTTTGKQNLDKVRAVVEYLFTTPNSMKEQNKYLLLFLQTLIQENNKADLKRFLSDEALAELHPSLLKSILIMIENVSDLEQSR